MTISNIPGPGPDKITFSGADAPVGSVFEVSSAGVMYIAPAAGKGFGPPLENYYRLDSYQMNYPFSLTYDGFINWDNYRLETASDRITWSLPTVVAPPPSLSIVANPVALTVSWATSPDAVILESSLSLTAPITWTALTNAVTDSAGQSSVTLATDEPCRFFRLTRP